MTFNSCWCAKLTLGAFLAAVVAITTSVSQLSNKHLVLWGKKDNLAFADEVGTVGQEYRLQYIFGAF